MSGVNKKIGEMNGGWGLLLRIMLATHPVVLALIIAWGTWVTRSIFELQGFANIDERFTASDARLMEAQCRARTDAAFVNVSGVLRNDLNDIRSLMTENNIEMRWWRNNIETRLTSIERRTGINNSIEN